MRRDGFVLGLSDDYVGNITLLHDGRPVFAAANERYTRKKGDAGFPQLALEAALDAAGLTLDDVDRIVVANRTHFVYRVMKAKFRDYTHDFFNVKQKAYLGYHDLMKRLPPLAMGVAAGNRLLLRARIGRKLSLCDHHLAHACSTIATSGFDDCLAISVDNLGDGYSAKVHTYRDGRIRYHYGSPASASPGQFYGEVAQILGFNPLRHAGKVTGLAAAGDPERAYPIVREIFGLAPDGRSFRLLPNLARWKHHGPYWKLALYSAADVAAAAQKRLEDVVCRFVSHAIERTGHDQLALAGGVFANVKLNLEVYRLPGVRTLHVHPAMSDEGLSFGAACAGMLADGQLAPAPMESAYLGSEYGQGQIDAALRAAGLSAIQPGNPAHAVAALLASGHIVARFAGRFEYGPRALGNRSILYRPDDPTVNDWLNVKLKRTEFMPFAPVSTWEDAEDCYQDVGPVKDAARFMTLAFDCTPKMRELCPGVVHLDGTARPQLVRRQDNPEYHEILSQYRRLTGLPCCINTSFNMHEEPIVCYPSDAVSAFLAADLDYLAIGSKIVANPRRPDLAETLNDVCAGHQ